MQVLLLEAGRPDTNPYIHMPVGFSKMTAGPLTWGLEDRAAEARQNREIAYAQARVLGGGGSINAEVFTRGRPADYDGWAGEYGATAGPSRRCSPISCARRTTTRWPAPGTHGGTARRLQPEARPPDDHGPSCRPARNMACPTIRTSTARSKPGPRLSDHDPQRPALLGRRRLSRAGSEPAEPHLTDRGPDLAASCRERRAPGRALVSWPSPS